MPFEALEEVGDFHYGSDGFSTALEYYENALQGLGIDQEFDPAVAAKLNRKISDCYRSKGLLEEALGYLERARGFLKGYEFELEYGIVLGRRAELQSAQGKHEAALRDAELALDILKATAAHREYAFVQTVAAACHGRLGHSAEFEQLNLDALATYRRIEDREGIANVYNNLGLAYKNACQWDKAIRSLTKAKEIYESLGMTRRLARTLGNLGIVYTKTRDFHEAISHLRRARKLVLALGDFSSLVSILNSLGRVLTMTGRYPQAEKCLLEARVLAERHHLARSMALADEFLGDLMLAQDHLGEARQNFESGLKRARAFAPKGDVVGELLRRLAELELRSGLRSQALATARRALKVCQGCGEMHEIGFIHRTMGLAQLGLGKLREAAGDLAASVAAFERTRNPYELAWSRTHLARVQTEQGGRELLLRAAREAAAAVETFRAVEEDLGYCTAGIVSARAHKALGNHDEGLLVLYEIERVCDENPTFGLLAEVRTLRKEFECALVSSVAGESSQLNLFSELYTLASSGQRFEANVEGVLSSLCAKSRASAAFIALMLPGRAEPVVKGACGMDPAEAVRLARLHASDALQPRVLAEGGIAEQFPEIAARAGALLVQPLLFEERTIGLLYLERPRAATSAAFGQDEIDFIATYASLAGVLIFENFREEYQAPEPQHGREDIHPALQRLITADPSMFQLMLLAEKVAGSNCTVLLSGETGTGKGLLAHSIHMMSERHGRKFMALNCAALPEPLLESELFGHVRGAFTGADSDKMGLLEAAHGGTVFLDEVGKTSLFMQGKLLQFLDSSEVRPVGSNTFKKVDVRVICASKSNLRDASAQGSFLEDLYYRLNDFPLAIPPLRDRRGDIKLLVDFYLRRYAVEMKKQIPGLSRQAMQILQGYSWPGNVRELEKCIKRAVILADDRQPITVRHLPDDVKSPERRALETCMMQEGLTLREHVAQVEAQIIHTCLRRAAGNKSEAARMLGISYPSLLQKIKLYGTSTGPAAL
jgi:transcriptional regulator with GAF, ATPase, and Fis domain/Flp pilus assembly protein TadD